MNNSILIKIFSPAKLEMKEENAPSATPKLIYHFLPFFTNQSDLAGKRVKIDFLKNAQQNINQYG